MSPGFEPSEPLLLARTTAETLQDEPPQDGQAYYYLVTAQHGSLADPPDHRLHGSAQVLRWVGRVPALGRRDNLFAPVPEDRGAHGSFDARARTFSPLGIAQRHRGALLLGAAAVVGALLWARPLRRGPIVQARRLAS